MLRVNITSPEQAGIVIRAARKAMQLRQDDAAGAIGVSENFLGKVERGGRTVQWGKLFQVMQELGLSIIVEVPEPFSEETLKLLTDMINRQSQEVLPVHTAQPGEDN